MFSPKRPRLQLSPSTVIASLALFFALGGGAAVAAQQFINGSRITPHSITLKQLSAQTIKELRGQAGSAGAQGAAGQTGAQGAAGQTGAKGAQGSAGTNGTTTTTVTSIGEVVVSHWVTFAADSGGSAEADCPAGKVAIAGGGGLGLGTQGGWNGVNDFVLQGSSPYTVVSTKAANSATSAASGPNAWMIEATNEIQFPASFPVYVICINQAAAGIVPVS